jgi:hypothetical protein
VCFGISSALHAQASTFKALNVFATSKPRSSRTLGKAPASSPLESFLDTAFVIDLDTGTVTAPLLDNGLGFAPATLAGYTELCTQLKAAASSTDDSPVDVNSSIQASFCDFVVSLIISYVGMYLDQHPAYKIISFDEASFLERVDERFRHFYHKVCTHLKEF